MIESISTLVREYTEAAQAHAREKLRDARCANIEHERLVHAFHELKALGDEGWSAIRRLVDYDDPNVRLWAATHLLQTDSETAVSALEALSQQPGFIGFEAGIVLTEWRAGKLTWA